MGCVVITDGLKEVQFLQFTHTRISKTCGITQVKQKLLVRC